jgi:L-histidine N-alpha-methyltransferase
VSESVLVSVVTDIGRTYIVPVTAIVRDFHCHLARLPQSGARLVAFLGGTIGNLHFSARQRLLTDLESTMGFAITCCSGPTLKKTLSG